MDSAHKTRLKRTRTGCFKCRVRRRKCDEGKPTCQRCVDGGFECHYGTRISFLDKNARTTTTSRSSSKPTYAKLRFLVPESVVARTDDVLQPVEDAMDEEEKQSSSAQADQFSSRQEHHLELPQVISPDLANFSIAFSPPDNLSHQPDLGTYASSISPSNTAYKTALDGLLSLGNDRHLPIDNYASLVDASHPQDEVHLGSPSQPHHLPATAANNHERAPSRSDFSNCRHMPQDRAIELLRHYRYHIAPWLDIGDVNRTFALAVPRIATGSELVLNSLLSLASSTIDQDVEPTATDDPYSLSTKQNDRSTPILYEALEVAFNSLQRFYTTSPTSWQSPSRSIGFDIFASPALSEQYPDSGLAASWLMLKLEISVGLINSSPVSIPALISYTASSPISPIGPASLHYHREPLLLCAKVLNHCFGGDQASTSPCLHPRPTAAEMWTSLLEALGMWYSNRPHEFKPMLEVDDDELFPLLLFTNGTAVLVNQLYHASMLLLLQNRPRTLPKDHRQRGPSVLLSPLWHAQRVCGISLNNDTRANWDFTLLSSLYLAAQRMTYEPQQLAILSGINRIGNLTGWNTGAISVQLINEWQSD